jgi:hypothetical protein
MLHIWAALLPTILAFASAQNNGNGGATYSQVTTVSVAGPGPTPTIEGPPVPTQTTVAVAPNARSYQLNSSFEITDKSVTRTFHWTISYVFVIVLDQPAYETGFRLPKCTVWCSRFAFFIWQYPDSLKYVLNRWLQSEPHYDQRSNARTTGRSQRRRYPSLLVVALGWSFHGCSLIHS